MKAFASYTFFYTVVVICCELFCIMCSTEMPYP